MNTNLRTAPHYFIIDSIGGMNEGYSDTTCRRVEDVVTPDLAKAMVEEYIDQWIHDIHEHWESEYGINVKFGHDECKYGGWHRVYVIADEFSPELAGVDINEGHTLFIQVYDGVMLGDGVVVYDQMDDMVRTITHKSTAIRMAEESISREVERIKWRWYNDKERAVDLKYAYNNLCHAYDSLAEVVRNIEWPQDSMVDIDDTCTHYFPTQAMKQMVYTDDNRITTL